MGDTVRYLELRAQGCTRSPRYRKALKKVLEVLEDKAAQPTINQSCEFSGEPRATFLVEFSPNKQLVASTHGDHTVRVTEIQTGKCTHVLTGHPRTPWCLAFNPVSDDILASGCLGGEVHIWDLRGGGSEVLKNPNEGQVIASLAFSPAGDAVVFATLNIVYFWAWTRSKPFALTQTKHAFERVRWVRFDPFGRYMYTGIANNQSGQRMPGGPSSTLFDSRNASSSDTREREAARERALSRSRYHSVLRRFVDLQDSQGRETGPRMSYMDASRPRSPANEEGLSMARQYAQFMTAMTSGPSAVHQASGALNASRNRDLTSTAQRSSRAFRDRDHTLSQSFVSTSSTVSSLSGGTFSSTSRAGNSSQDSASQPSSSLGIGRERRGNWGRYRPAFFSLSSEGRPSQQSRDPLFTVLPGILREAASSYSFPSVSQDTPYTPSLRSEISARETDQYEILPVDHEIDPNVNISENNSSARSSVLHTSELSRTSNRQETARQLSERLQELRCLWRRCCMSTMESVADHAPSSSSSSTGRTVGQPCQHHQQLLRNVDPFMGHVENEGESSRSARRNIDIALNTHASGVSQVPSRPSIDGAAVDDRPGPSGMCRGAGTSGSTLSSCAVGNELDTVEFNVSNESGGISQPSTSSVMKDKCKGGSRLWGRKSRPIKRLKNLRFTKFSSSHPSDHALSEQTRDDINSPSSLQSMQLEERNEVVRESSSDRHPVSGNNAELQIGKTDLCNQCCNDGIDSTGEVGTSQRESEVTDRTGKPQEQKQLEGDATQTSDHGLSAPLVCKVGMKRKLEETLDTIHEGVKWCATSNASSGLGIYTNVESDAYTGNSAAHSDDLIGTGTENNSSVSLEQESRSKEPKRPSLGDENFGHSTKMKTTLLPPNTSVNTSTLKYESHISHAHSSQTEPNTNSSHQGVIISTDSRGTNVPPSNNSHVPAHIPNTSSQSGVARGNLQPFTNSSSTNQQIVDESTQSVVTTSSSQLVANGRSSGLAVTNCQQFTGNSVAHSIFASPSMQCCVVSTSVQSNKSRPSTQCNTSSALTSTSLVQYNTLRASIRHDINCLLASESDESDTSRPHIQYNVASTCADLTEVTSQDATLTLSRALAAVHCGQSTTQSNHQSQMSSLYPPTSALHSSPLSSTFSTVSSRPRTATISATQTNRPTTSSRLQMRRTFGRASVQSDPEQISTSRETSPSVLSAASALQSLSQPRLNATRTLSSIFGSMRGDDNQPLNLSTRSRDSPRPQSIHSVASRLNTAQAHSDREDHSRLSRFLERRFSELDRRISNLEEVYNRRMRYLYNDYLFQTHRARRFLRFGRRRLAHFRGGRGRTSDSEQSTSSILSGQPSRARSGASAERSLSSRLHGLSRLEAPRSRPSDVGHQPSRMRSLTLAPLRLWGPDDYHRRLQRNSSTSGSSGHRGQSESTVTAPAPGSLRQQLDLSYWRRGEDESEEEEEDGGLPRRWSANRLGTTGIRQSYGSNEQGGRSDRQRAGNVNEDDETAGQDDELDYLHPDYRYSVLNDSFRRQDDSMHFIVNSTIAGAFLSRDEQALANNFVPQTYRIQRWSIAEDMVPDISQATSNVIVRHCKLHNDASCSLSSDGKLLAAFVPTHKGFPDKMVLGVFSLETDSFAQCLYTKSFGPNAISVSISPENNYALVGMAAKRFFYLSANQMVGQVFKLVKKKAGESSMQLASDLYFPENRNNHCSVNSARWLPTAGMGLVFGTNKGDLVLSRPGSSKTVEQDEEEDGEPALLPNFRHREFPGSRGGFARRFRNPLQDRLGYSIFRPSLNIGAINNNNNNMGSSSSSNNNNNNNNSQAQGRGGWRSSQTQTSASTSGIRRSTATQTREDGAAGTEADDGTQL